MGKVNIYFRDDLEAEAREVGVKWSPVCQAAVRSEVDRLRRVAEAPSDLAKVAKRILETREEQYRKDFNEGYDAGRAWASDRATYSDLDRLSNYFERSRWVAIDIMDYDTIQEFLFNRALRLGHDADPDWFERLDEDSAFDKGFLEGARDIYEAVRPFLDTEPD